MAKYTDAEGNEVEAFTAEEVEAQKAAALEEANKNNPAVTALQADLEKVKAERDALSNKDMNFANVKESLAKKDEAIAELNKKIEEATANQINEMRSEVLDNLSGGDADLKAKIEAEMKTFRDQPTTRAEMAVLAQKALSIVKPVVAPGAFDAFSAANRGGAGAGNAGAGKEYTPTPEVASMGQKMGISDEDWKKYGGGIK